MTIEVSKLAGARDWWSLAVLTVAVVLLAVDGTVLAVAIPSVAADLGATSAQMLWIGDIYAFMLAGLMVLTGNLADRFGRKRLLIVGTVAFGLASVVAAMAPTAEWLIVGRALLGASGAVILPATLSLIRSIFRDPMQRRRAIAIWSAGASAGGALGPLLGGLLLEHFWWGSIFLINVPILVVLLLGAWALIPESRNPEPGRVDLPSVALSIVAILSTVYAVKKVMGEGLQWDVLLTAAIGVGAAVVFVRRQRVLTTPLIDTQLFRIPAFSGAVIACTIGVFSFSGLLFFFSQYLQLVDGHSPLQAGLIQLPVTLGSISVAFLVGVLIRRLGLGPAIGGALLLAAAGLSLMPVAIALPGFLWTSLPLVLIGIGQGAILSLGTDAVVSAAPLERAGAASSVAATGYELGIALGIGVLGGMQNAFYRLLLDLPETIAVGDEQAIRESLASAFGSLGGSPAHEELWEQAQSAFAQAVVLSSLTAAAIALVAGVVAFRLIPADGKERPGDPGQRKYSPK